MATSLLLHQVDDQLLHRDRALGLCFAHAPLASSSAPSTRITPIGGQSAGTSWRQGSRQQVAGSRQQAAGSRQQQRERLWGAREAGLGVHI